MCRAGLRHCEEDPAKRRARQKAAYHANKNANGGTAVIDNPDTATPDVEPETTSEDTTQTKAAFLNQLYGLHLPEDYTGGNPTDEQLRSAATAVSNIVTRHSGQMTTLDNNGFHTPTTKGEATVEAVQYLGDMIESRVQAEVTDDDVFEAVQASGKLVGTDTHGPFNTRDEYDQHVRDTFKDYYEQLKDHYAHSREMDQDEALATQRRLVSQLEPYREEYPRVAMGLGAWAETESNMKSEARLKALSTIREMGFSGECPATSINASKSHKTGIGRLHGAMQYYPTTWLARDTVDSGEGELVVVSRGGRAYYGKRYYRHSGELAFAQLTTDKDNDSALAPGMSTTIHEYGHRQEGITPDANEVCQTFLAIRTGGAERDALTPLYENKNSRKKLVAPTRSDQIQDSMRRTRAEWARPDSFVTSYAGKDYGAGVNNSEVLTIGMEGVFAGRYGGMDGGGRYKADAGHKNLILGLLASVK